MTRPRNRAIFPGARPGEFIAAHDERRLARCEIFWVTEMSLRGVSCIVLGGGGFIGANLCRRLASSGLRVRAFGRRCLFPEALDGVEWYQGNFSDAAALAAAMETYDVVFHLVHATTPHSANLDMAADVQQNVMSSLALMDISRNLGVKRVVFVSSGGTVYGPAAQIPTPETAPTEPITAYGISKLAIEKYFALYQRLYGLDYRILRVANPFGPYWFPARCVTSASKYGEMDRPCVTIFSSMT
jgi:UDP-glucose 4-epimerase